MVDVLPKGILVEEVSYSKTFQDSNGTHEIIHNYQSTGQTAVVFRAENLNIEASKSNKYKYETEIAKIKTICDYGEDGTYLNHVYAKVDNNNPIEAVRLEEQTEDIYTINVGANVSHATVANHYILYCIKRNWFA